MSQPLPLWKWRTLSVLSTSVAIALSVMAALSLSGYNDPMSGWRVAQRITSLNDLTQIGSSSRWELLALPPAPYMIEARWDSPEATLSRWGFWLEDTSGEQYQRLVDETGAISTSTDAGWQPFIHIRPSSNVLLIQVEDDALIWRINGEIASTASLQTDRVGLVLPHIADSSIVLTIYTRP